MPITKEVLVRVIFTLIFIFFLLHLLHIFLYPNAVNGDAAILTHRAIQLLEGDTPFVDYFDVNSPTIIYFSAIPVIIAQAIHVSVIPVFSLFVLAIVGWSATSCYYILRSFVKGSSLVHLYIPLIILIHSLWLLITDNFGEREHLFIVAYLPFLFLRWTTWESNLKVNKGFAAALGISAALATIFKPHFVLIAAAPEIYFLSKKRTLRPFYQIESLVVVVTGIVFILHFLLLPKEAIDTLTDYSLPLFAEEYDVWNPRDSFLRNSLFMLFLNTPYFVFTGVVVLRAFKRPVNQQTQLSGVGR